jgi:hypothetical protein
VRGFYFMPVNFESLDRSVELAFAESVVYDPDGLNETIKAVIDRNRQDDYDAGINVEVIEMGFISAAITGPVENGTVFGIDSKQYQALTPPIKTGTWSTVMLEPI